ncbi:MAG: TrbI/VirB10 family protein [Deltaproteobacteria bacterium]|nr:TrbI/VirB10 family protein [Deltaproteobacteria bacterium]
MSKASIKILDMPSEPTSLWQKVLSFLHIQKEGKKYTIKRTIVFSTVGVLIVIVAAVHLMLDRNRPNALSSIAAPESRLTSTLPQTVDVPAAASSGKNESKKAGGNFQGPTVSYRGPQVIARPKDLGSIPPGSMLWAKLLNGASNGLVRAEVTEGLSVNGETKIPAGALLVGNGNSTEERLFIHFNQVVFKDGTMGSVDGQACDKSDKIVGLKGSKVGNKAIQIAGSIGLGFLGGFSEGLQDSEGQQGAVVKKPTLKNALLNATATTALEQSKELMSDLKNRVPILEVPEGTPLCVIFAGASQ